MLLAIEKRLRLNLSAVKKVIRKFLQGSALNIVCLVVSELSALNEDSSMIISSDRIGLHTLYQDKPSLHYRRR